MKKSNPIHRKDGFFNLVANELPVLTEGVAVQNDGGPIGPPIRDYANPPTDPTFVPDPAFEVDLNSLNCKQLKQFISDLQNYLQTTKFSAAAVTYYNAKLDQAQSYLLKCSNDTGSVDCVQPPCNKTSGGGTGGSTGSGGGSTGTGGAVLLPTGSTVTVGPALSGGAGGGAGSSSGSTNAAKKKNNWLIWAASALVLGVVIHYTNKE